MPLPELNVPSWLGPGEPAGAPMLRGVQAGSMIAGNLMQARAQRERSIMAREQQREHSEAVKLESALHQQQLEEARLRVKELASTRERSLAAQGMLATAGEMVGRAIIAPIEDTASREAVYGVFSRFPGLASIPQGKALWDAFQNAEGDAADMQRQIAVAKARGPLGAATDTAAIRNAAYLSTLRKDAEALRTAGDTAGFQLKQQEIADIEEQIQKGQSFRVFDPATGNVTAEMSSGRGAGTPGATVATQTAGQKRLIDYGVAVEGITDVLGKLRSDDVGVRGIIGENVFDTWVEQVAPGTRSTERIENRAALRSLGEQLIQSLSSDTSGRFSDKDVARLKEMTDSVGISKSFGEVKDRLNAVRDIVKDRSRIHAQSLKQPVPDFAKTEQELADDYEAQKVAIQQRVKNGGITREQGDAQLKAAYTNSSALLRRFYPPPPPAP